MASVLAGLCACLALSGTVMLQVAKEERSSLELPPIMM